MKGYVTASGYMGLIEGRYILFATEDDYVEYWVIHEIEEGRA